MRSMSALVLATLVFVTAPWPAQAQALGTFRWKLEPYGSVLNLTLTQKGNHFEVEGFEFQCGANLSLPVTGLIVPQANGSFFFGLTSINENGRGLHTRAYMTVSNNFGGTWSDNAGNTNQSFLYQTGPQPPSCSGGPRTGPLSPDQGPATAADAGTTQSLLAELDVLRARLAALEARKQ